MEGIFRLFLSLFFIFLLSGCIAEDWDFNPPIVTLLDTENALSVELELVNLDWRGEENAPIRKENADVVSIGKQQEPLYSESRRKIEIQFNNQDFEIYELNISLLRKNNDISLLWKNGEWKEWQALLDGGIHYFMTPLEKGKYTMELVLETDRGTAQYVGNLVVH